MADTDPGSPQLFGSLRDLTAPVPAVRHIFVMRRNGSATEQRYAVSAARPVPSSVFLRLLP